MLIIFVEKNHQHVMLDRAALSKNDRRILGEETFAIRNYANFVDSELIRKNQFCEIF